MILDYSLEVVVKENITFSEKFIRIPKSFDDNRNL